MEIDGIKNIIKEPVHGSQFYTKETFIELINKLAQIFGQLEITNQTDSETAIAIIKNYIKYNVNLRSSYFDAFCERCETFDRNELIYRTAYGALVKGEAMCEGCAEAVRMLLEIYGIKSYTLLSKLPGSNKRLLHYVVAAEYEKDGETHFEILDPERQANCEKKGMDYERYKSNMIYVIPNTVFTNNVIGDTGLGMEAEEYLSHESIPRVYGTKEIGKLVEIIKDERKKLMENKKQMKLIEINGKYYKIDTKIYIPAGEMKEIIIACHGFAGDKESSAIEALANEMTENNVGVICFDFPGHGKSEVNADKLTIDNCIQDVNDIEKFVIDTYGNIPISIFATSFGAYITLINIARNNKRYKNIILRSPAIRMEKIYKDTLLRESLEEYKKRGYTKLGFEREMLVLYSFLEELEKNDIFKIFENKEIPNMYIIQGNQDDIAPIKDTEEFIEEHKENIKLFIIPGADHRMKEPGELEKAMEYSKKIILR